MASRCRRLTLRCEGPSGRCPTVGVSCWKSTEGSVIWNYSRCEPCLRLEFHSAGEKGAVGRMSCAAKGVRYCVCTHTCRTLAGSPGGWILCLGRCARLPDHLFVSFSGWVWGTDGVGRSHHCTSYYVCQPYSQTWFYQQSWNESNVRDSLELQTLRNMGLLCTYTALSLWPSPINHWGQGPSVN